MIAALGITKITGAIAAAALVAGFGSGAFVTKKVWQAREAKALRIELADERAAKEARESTIQELLADRDHLQADYDAIASSNARLRAQAGQDTIRYINEVSKVKDDTPGQCLGADRPSGLYAVLQAAYSGDSGSAKAPANSSELAGGAASPKGPD